MFIGRVRTDWHDNKRDMILVDDFAFIDSRGVKWTAPAGLIFDGASIPQFLWSIFGSPYTGPYRNAAVIHDAHWQEDNLFGLRVHEVFWEAMIYDKTPRWKANLFYFFVVLYCEHYVPLKRKLRSLWNGFRRTS